MFFPLRHQLIKRCINNSSRILQQYQPRGGFNPSGYNRQGGFPSQQQQQLQPLGFPQQQSDLEDAHVQSFSDVPGNSPVVDEQQQQSHQQPITRFASTKKFEPPTTSTIQSISPFPEELDQDYDSVIFEEAAKEPFSKDVSDILQSPLAPEEIEVKPDGAIYLPESRYRKVLFKAFGPGGWALIPRGAHSFTSGGVLSREYALFCQGRFVSQARGHIQVPSFSNPAMASEAVRSNALMRVCKDIGIGNELWDPQFIQEWKQSFATRKTDMNGKTKWVKNVNIA